VAHYDRFADNLEDFSFSHQMRFYNSILSQRLLVKPNKTSDPFSEFLNKNAAFLKPLNVIQRAQFLEFTTLLQGYLLSSQGDRMALANSVENRAPFLDYKVVEFLKNIPLDYKLKDGCNEKYILKEAFKDKLPHSIYSRNKQPYRAPDAKTFVEMWGTVDYMGLLLSENELKKSTIINPKAASNFTKRILNINSDSISAAQNQAFLFLLSTRLLEDQFLNVSNSSNSDPKVPIVVNIDGDKLRY
tara:strand:- start:106 stop:837 length:732 start_codon:yes stop_codon:yes gene_type:complete